MPPRPPKPIDKAAIVAHLHKLGRHRDALRADDEMEDRLYTAQDASLLARFNIDPAYIEGLTYPDRLDVTRETFRDRPPRES
jgi:hypothetical protein